MKKIVTLSFFVVFLLSLPTLGLTLSIPSFDAVAHYDFMALETIESEHSFLSTTPTLEGRVTPNPDSSVNDFVRTEGQNKTTNSSSLPSSVLPLSTILMVLGSGLLGMMVLRRKRH